MVKGQA